MKVEHHTLDGEHFGFEGTLSEFDALFGEVHTCTSETETEHLTVRMTFAQASAIQVALDWSGVASGLDVGPLGRDNMEPATRDAWRKVVHPSTLRRQAGKLDITGEPV